MKVKFLCSFCSDSQCLANYMHVYGIKTRLYKNIEFVNDNSFTHIVIIGDINNRIINFLNKCNVKKENIIRFSFEPLEFSNTLITNKIAEYRISKAERFNADNFKNGYTFQWHHWKKNLISNTYLKPLKMSIILSSKKIVSGHKYRHLLVNKILSTNLDIHIYGTGSKEHGNDPRIKGIFSDLEPYNDYMYSIAIENTPDTELYISEKFTNCIVSNTIPIYYGADKVNDIFGNDCCYKLCGDLNKDFELITNIYNNCEKYKLNLEKAQYELFNGNAFLPHFLHDYFNQEC